VSIAVTDQWLLNVMIDYHKYFKMVNKVERCPWKELLSLKEGLKIAKIAER
jgi:hypothetical protein